MFECKILKTWFFLKDIKPVKWDKQILFETQKTEITWCYLTLKIISEKYISVSLSDVLSIKNNPSKKVRNWKNRV